MANRLKTGSVGRFGHYGVHTQNEQLRNCLRIGAGGGNRTHTSLAGPRILSPVRLPVPPPRRLVESIVYAGCFALAADLSANFSATCCATLCRESGNVANQPGPSLWQRRFRARGVIASASFESRRPSRARKRSWPSSAGPAAIPGTKKMNENNRGRSRPADGVPVSRPVPNRCI